MFTPDQVHQQGKEPVRKTNNNGHKQPTLPSTKLKDNALKKALFRLNNHTRQVNDMSNK